nr:ubiquitin-conjugating enzyme e2 7 [Quercus suber]
MLKLLKQLDQMKNMLRLIIHEADNGFAGNLIQCGVKLIKEILCLVEDLEKSWWYLDDVRKALKVLEKEVLCNQVVELSKNVILWYKILNGVLKWGVISLMLRSVKILKEWRDRKDKFKKKVSRCLRKSQEAGHQCLFSACGCRRGLKLCTKPSKSSQN